VSKNNCFSLKDYNSDWKSGLQLLILRFIEAVCYGSSLANKEKTLLVNRVICLVMLELLKKPKDFIFLKCSFFSSLKASANFIYITPWIVGTFFFSKIH